MISLDNISVTFNATQPSAVKALNNFSLKINTQEFLVIVGTNGSGKSTLLNCIAGSCFADEGKIFINDIDVTKTKDFERAKWISRVFQNPLQGTAPDLSILDNFRIAALRTASKKIFIGINDNFIKKVKDQISILNMGLEDKVHLPMGVLSGGQRQALTLLMSVMDKTKVLLLDEPTAALDPKSGEIVMKTADLLTQKMNLTTILITHNLKEASYYGNRIIQMHQGKIVRDFNAIQKPQLSSTEIFSWF